MDRFPVVSRRAVSSVVIALGLMLTVVGTAPAVVAAEEGTRYQSALVVTRLITEPVWDTQTFAPAPETTQQAQFDNEFLYVPVRRYG